MALDLKKIARGAGWMVIRSGGEATGFIQVDMIAGATIGPGEGAKPQLLLVGGHVVEVPEFSMEELCEVVLEKTWERWATATKAMVP